MSQTDMVVADQDGASFLVDINAHLAAIVSQNSGATEPATMYAYQLWADTSSGILKQRTAANDGWINKGNLADVDWGLLNKSGGTMSGLLNLAAGADIASASTVDLTAATGNCPKVTGATPVTAWTMNTGQQMTVIADGALPLTYHATTNNIEGGSSYTCAAGDIINLVKGLDGVIRVRIEKQDGRPVAGGTIFASNSEYVTGTDTTKALNSATARARNIVIGTEVTLTNQTSVDFTDIPDWVKRITISFSAVSTNGTSIPIIQLGDAGGIEPTGYVGSASIISTTVGSTLFTNGLAQTTANAMVVTFNGQAVFTKISALRWAGTWITGRNDSASTSLSATSKVLSDTLTQVRVTTVNGTDQYDAGVINILYE